MFNEPLATLGLWARPIITCVRRYRITANVCIRYAKQYGIQVNEWVEERLGGGGKWLKVTGD